jgi:hypothetical protein
VPSPKDLLVDYLSARDPQQDVLIFIATWRRHIERDITTTLAKHRLVQAYQGLPFANGKHFTKKVCRDRRGRKWLIVPREKHLICRLEVRT